MASHLWLTELSYFSLMACFPNSLHVSAYVWKRVFGNSNVHSWNFKTQNEEWNWTLPTNIQKYTLICKDRWWEPKLFKLMVHMTFHNYEVSLMSETLDSCKEPQFTNSQQGKKKLKYHSAFVLLIWLYIIFRPTCFVREICSRSTLWFISIGPSSYLYKVLT